MIQFYVTRDSNGTIGMQPATEGIRKIHGCIEYRNATINWRHHFITSDTCWQLFGFVPKKEEAWYVRPDKTGLGCVKTKVELEFS